MRSRDDKGREGWTRSRRSNRRKRNERRRGDDRRNPGGGAKSGSKERASTAGMCRLRLNAREEMWRRKEERERRGGIDGDDAEYKENGAGWV